jgi:NAD-dependent SIR2 family protein deacetylase
MPYSNRYIPGDRLMTCDECGYDYRFSDMRRGKAKGQKGLELCPECYDPIHPRDDKPKLRPKKPLPEVK